MLDLVCCAVEESCFDHMGSLTSTVRANSLGFLIWVLT